MVSSPEPRPPQAGCWCSRHDRRPDVRRMGLPCRPRHATGSDLGSPTTKDHRCSNNLLDDSKPQTPERNSTDMVGPETSVRPGRTEQTLHARPTLASMTEQKASRSPTSSSIP